MKLCSDLFESLDMMKDNKFSGCYYDRLKDVAGTEHYRMLAWLSTQYDNIEIFDIGTDSGISAAALSYNKNNKVNSFDIDFSRLQHKVSNCEYFQEDLWNPEIRNKWKARILNSPLIFLDIDPHEGCREYEFYRWLVENDYKGLLVLDDIWYFKPMRDNLWYKISTKKFDATRFGHWSGTGIVDFGNILENETPNTDNWTLVTAYFDLTKEFDSTKNTDRRPTSEYFETMHTTLSVEQNLIVFCEEDDVEKIKSYRPAHLLHKTKFIIQKFSDFEITNTRDKIIQNKIDKPYSHDGRCTATYYTFCMSRYIMINRAIEENPFNSTHFAWINICIERMGWKNAQMLNHAFSLNRDKFSTCWIDYQPKQLVENYSEYFKWGRCGMCSGFFTGRADYFKEFNKYILEEFYDCLEKGYGHADEQLYSIVYWKHPEIFDPYFGDYADMVTNYDNVIDRVSEPVRNLIQNSFNHGDYEVCLQGCLRVLPSINKLPDDYKKLFMLCFMQSAIQLNKIDLLTNLF